MPRPAEASSLRLVTSLALTGLLSGLVLVGVYLLTAPRIERNRAEALNAAIFRVLPGTTEVTAYVVEDETPRPFVAIDGSLPHGEAVFVGRADDGRLIGFAIPASGAGFQDTIGLIYGYDPQRKVIIGMEVLDSRETPGLGDKIIVDADFLANFQALEVLPEIVAVKKGAKSDPNQVDCITGATISSEAVVQILNDSSRRWLPLLETIRGIESARSREGGDEPHGGG
ncbi:MAG: FMN-binding protein [Acidobacteriota bacterium]|nr:FMN-binding protein [Acidobacteriota bacterium]MDH3784339.1 FMN-binding protein [Acidobacteriota bacterium]